MSAARLREAAAAYRMTAGDPITIAVAAWLDAEADSVDDLIAAISSLEYRSVEMTSTGPDALAVADAILGAKS